MSLLTTLDTPEVATAASGPTLLSSISGLNVEFELDATLEASYGGSGQTWANVIESPYTGAAQTLYDVYLGADGSVDTSDPTFSVNLFTLDGGDWFTIKDAAQNTSPGFWNDLHNTTSGHAFWIAFRYKPGDIGAKRVICNRYLEAGTQINGIEILVTPGSGVRPAMKGSGGALTGSYAGTIAVGTTHNIIVSFDADTLEVKIWVDAATAVSTQDFSSYSDTGDTSAASIGICATHAAGLSPVVAGSEFSHLSCGKAYMTDALAAQVLGMINARRA